MLLRNLNAMKGLLNGTRLIVRKMFENSLDLEIITGRELGQRVLLPRIDLSPSDTNVPFSFKRRQFPVKVAFCIQLTRRKDKPLTELQYTYLNQSSVTVSCMWLCRAGNLSKKSR